MMVNALIADCQPVSIMPFTMSTVVNHDLLFNVLLLVEEIFKFVKFCSQ
jgi:hypothetical protein